MEQIFKSQVTGKNGQGAFVQLYNADQTVKGPGVMPWKHCRGGRQWLSAIEPDKTVIEVPCVILKLEGKERTVDIGGVTHWVVENADLFALKALWKLREKLAWEIFRENIPLVARKSGDDPEGLFRYVEITYEYQGVELKAKLDCRDVIVDLDGFTGTPEERLQRHRDALRQLMASDSFAIMQKEPEIVDGRLQLSVYQVE